jgi:DNA processing protein
LIKDDRMPLFTSATAAPVATPLCAAELEARLALHQLPDTGSVRLQKLVEAFGSAEAAMRALPSAWRSVGASQAAIDQRRSARTKAGVLAAMRWLERSDQSVLMWDQADYPALLAEIDDAPALLFVAGDCTILDHPQLAIVGSRRASRPGMDSAAAFSRSLAQLGFTITSGLALGIDGAAHRAAVDMGGTTIAVVGTGLEKLYPQRHRQLAIDIRARGGALVSEFPLATDPIAGNFPRRNRIISGLSLGVLVIEATLASGSLITARMANEQGREVFALPGSIHHPGAKGCHQLIRNGAVLVENIEHILEALRGWQQVALPPTAIDPGPLRGHPLFELLRASPHTTEGLALNIGWPLPKVLAALTELEMDGRVICEAGRWFARPG